MNLKSSTSASVKLVFTILLIAAFNFATIFFVSREAVDLSSYVIPAAYALNTILFALLLWQVIDLLIKLRRTHTQLQTKGAGEFDAKQANQELIRHVSHKIRTPLNTLTSSIELLKSSELMDYQQDPINIMGSSLDAVHVLINDIVDTTVVQKGGIRLNPEVVSLNEFLESLNTAIHPLADANGLVLDLDWPSHENIGVQMDPLRLRQVLYNVLYNFVSYNDKGRVKLVLDPEYLEDETVILRFEVKGLQIGMDDQQFAQFQDFLSNLSHPIQDRPPFLDLGLYISTAIIQAMGGTIEASRTNENEVCLVIAIRPTVSYSTAHNGPAATDSSETLADGQNSAAHTRLSRALIVDDIPVNRFMMKKVIDSLGIVTDQASNGKEALDAVQQTTYELLLMDITMPVMDGIEATRRIRATKLDKQPVIVAVTANAVDACQEQSVEAGMDAFIAKPFKLEQIRAILEDYFDLDRAGKPRIKLQ